MVLHIVGIHLLKITLTIYPISRDPLPEKYLNEDIKLIVPNVVSDRPYCVCPGMGVGFMICLNLVINQWLAL